MRDTRLYATAAVLAAAGLCAFGVKAFLLGVPLAPAGPAALSDSSWLHLTLFALPPEIQELHRVLLMIPVGAFLIVVLRNIVGLRTYGTFLPVLVALAFRETRLLVGIALFTLLLVLGLGARFYLEKLRLLLVPRLAAVLVVVVLCMIVISIVSSTFGLATGLSVALFPIVILTMAIEHMSIHWEERGGGEAAKQGFGTLVVASVAYVVMNVDVITRLFLVFPELLLVLLASILLLGRYSGYRLLELKRFSAFSEESP